MEEIKQTPTKQTRKKRPGISAFLCAGIILCFIVLFVFASQWKEGLKVDRVVVEGANILAGKDLVDLASITPQIPVYETNLYEVRRRLLKQPMLKHVSVTRQLPDAIHIAVVERQPVASLGGNQLRHVDAEGVLLPRLETGVQLDLPLISGVGNVDSIRYGDVVGRAELFEALRLLELGQTIGFYHSISEVQMNEGGDIVLYTTEGGVEVLMGRGSFGKKLLTLQTFWNNFAKPGVLDRLRYVDLRFEGQVVVKWDSQGERKSSARL